GVRREGEQHGTVRTGVAGVQHAPVRQLGGEAEVAGRDSLSDRVQVRLVLREVPAGTGVEQLLYPAGDRHAAVDVRTERRARNGTGGHRTEQRYEKGRDQTGRERRAPAGEAQPPGTPGPAQQATVRILDRYHRLGQPGEASLELIDGHSVPP